MSKFTTQEVEALQKGGNQRARELFLKDFDTQRMRLPESSNIDNLRDFIKAVYVERRYAGGRFSERPPRDTQNQKAHEEHRRASSYHSFSQSPPNDYQYEERRNGKQAVLTRKPGSDRGHDGKISGFAYSPNSLHEKMSEDRFANESSGSRTSDCSSDTFRTAPQSPNLQDNGYSSSPAQQAEPNTRTFSAVTPSQRTSSSGSIDSMSLKSANSSLADMSFEPENGHGNQQNKNSIPPNFAVFSDAVYTANNDLFNLSVVQQQSLTGLDPPVDLFADMKSQPPTTPSANKTPVALSLDNAGWATFDTPPEEPHPSLNGLSSVVTTSKEMQTLDHDLFLLIPNNMPTWLQASETNASSVNQFGVPSRELPRSIDTTTSQPWSAFDNSTVSVQQTSSGTPLIVNSDSQESKGPIDGNNSQFWHSFDDVSGIMAQSLSSALPQNEHKNVVNVSLATSNPFTCSDVSVEPCNDGSQKLFTDEPAPNVPFAFFVEPPPISAVPPMGETCADQKPINPFDLPFDTDSEAVNMFMDMSALQEALPNQDLPSALLDSWPETWFSNNAAAYVPPGSHGGLPRLVDQVPNSPLRNIPVATVSTGNPFA